MDYRDPGISCIRIDLLQHPVTQVVIQYDDQFRPFRQRLTQITWFTPIPVLYPLHSPLADMAFLTDSTYSPPTINAIIIAIPSI